MSSIDLLQSVVLDLPPCCIEFNPDDSRYAVIGTYNLEKPAEQQEPNELELSDQNGGKISQSRNGSLLLVKVVGDYMYVGNFFIHTHIF